MRNSKVKTLKKTALFTLSLLLLSTGSVIAQTWSEFETSVNSGTATLENDVTATSTITPPVPATINGNNNTIDAFGYTTGSVFKFVGNDTTVNNLNITGANNPTLTGTGVDDGGGAILNENGTLTIQSTGTEQNIISNNKSVNGGAIANLGTGVLNIDNIKFENNEVSEIDATTVGLGGAIYNSSTATGINLNIQNSSFINNRAHTPASGGYGGAIFHDHGTATISGSFYTENDELKSTSTFEDNYAENDGGAIVNRADMTISNSIFNNNSAKINAGAIVNDGTAHDPSQNANLTITNTIFSNNHAGASSSGGAILNSTSDANLNTTNKVTINQGTKFINNYIAAPDGSLSSTSGGAIMNQGANSTSHKDAILIINGGDTDSTKVLFQNNIAANGGAITNRGQATIKNAIFDSNGTSTNAAGKMTNNGGAIYNQRMMLNTEAALTVENSSFINNRVGNKGGAVYNKSHATFIDSDFSGNGAGATPTLANGGAIYTTVDNYSTDSTTTIIARNKDVNIGNEDSLTNGTDSLVFEGKDNSSLATPTANYIVTGNFYANEGRTVNIYSNVYGSRATDGSLLADINFGKTGVDSETNKPYTGTVRFNGNSTISSSNINIYSGTAAFDHDKNLAATNILNMYGGTLNLVNGEYVDQLQPKEFHLRGDSHIMLDVDIDSETMDRIITSDTLVKRHDLADGTVPTLTVDEFYSKNSPTNSEAMILFSDAPDLLTTPEGKEVVVQGEGAKVLQTPTLKYEVTKYENPEGKDDGVYFGFKQIGPSDPAISGPVAAQAAFIMMDNIYRQSFANMDMVALMTPEQREMIKALRCGNRIDWKREKGYVTGVFAPNTVPEERDGLYVRPFANFENVPLKNGPRVSNVFYGSLIGGESDLIDLGHGWDGTFSFFGAYHGSHQAYQGVDIWQNGGTLGAVGTVYKGRFFSGLTANVGASAAEARHGFGNDQFPILMTGAAWKSGYNIGMFTNKLILQPSYMMSYTFVNVFDYNSASGVRITQDPLNVLEIVPGVKLIGNLKNGWQPYLGANITWNIMDKTKFYADNVMLPQLSVKPFVEYGLGMQKRYGDRFTGYGQAMFRSGGRNGVAFTLGLRWALGN